MKITRGYKTELDPTSEHYRLLCQCAGIARFAYNYGLRRKQEAYKAGEKTPYAVQLQKELTARKHDDEMRSIRRPRLLWRKPSLLARDRLSLC